jgi:WD40 repeat protein
MSDRPAIPIETQRQVLLQARHRCAACCEPTALEKAHIIPWHKTHDHSESNLVALCANCHARSHSENWDKVVLLHYKEHPCALERTRDRLPPMPTFKRTLVDLVVAADVDEMTETERVRLISVIAAYLDLSISEVRIRSVKPDNSARVRLEMPGRAAERLIDGFREHDSKLFSFFREFAPESPYTYIKDIRLADSPELRQHSTFLSKVAGFAAFALRASSKDDIVVGKSALRAVMAVVAASLAFAVISILLAEYQMMRLRPRELAVGQSQAALLAALSINEEARGGLDRALKYAVLGADFELSLPGDSAVPPLARRQLASLAAQSVKHLGSQSIAAGIRLAGLSANAALLFTVSDDQTARIWDTASSKEVTTGEHAEGSVLASAFNPDGSRVALAMNDGTVKIWEWATGSKFAVLADNRVRLTSTEFSPDGLRLAVGSEDGKVQIVELPTGRVIRLLQHEAPILDTAFSPDGSLLAAASGQRVRIWNLATGIVDVELTSSAGCFSVAFSPNGSLLACADGRAVQLWNLAKGERDRPLRAYDEVKSATFNFDGSRIIAASDVASASVWNVATGDEIASVRSGARELLAVRFGPEGANIIAAASDYTIRVWDVAVLLMPTKELIARTCRQGLIESTRLTRDEMGLAGFPATISDIDVCSGVKGR